MWNTIKEVFLGILEGLTQAKRYKLYGHAQWYTENYLAQSVDAADLKKRQEDLRAKGYL